MKLAVLLFGDYREFEKASISYEVFKDHDVDFFISTWKHTTSYDSSYNTSTKEITLKNFNKFLPKEPEFASIVEESSFPDFDFTQKMIKHWKILGEELKTKKEKYTAVLLVRIEFYITHFDFNQIIEEAKDGKLHVIYGGLTKTDDGYFVNDISHSSSMEIMLQYIDMLPLDPPMVSHTDFGNLLFKSEIQVADQKSVFGRLLRPTTSNFLTNHHKENIVIMEDNAAVIDELFEHYSVWYHTYIYQNPPTITFKEYLEDQR